MTVVHVVFIKLKPEADAAKIAESAKESLSKISLITSVKVGIPFNDPAQTKGYNLTVVIELADEAALKEYADHPAHVELAGNILRPNSVDIVASDFKI